VGVQVASRAWVVKENEKHFAPEMLVLLVVDERTKQAACLSECGRGTGVTEKRRDDNDLFNEFRRE
jgi:hypothetical protein